MFDSFLQGFAIPDVSLGQVLFRLLMSVLLGALVSEIYKHTSHQPDAGSSSLPITLTLMAILIAMVTQVIGDNVARAFSLVGALSIVRFRTVVRDTRDTAFVIFAVVVGMAVGSGNYGVAVLGLLITGATAFIFSRRITAVSSDEHLPVIIVLRAALGQDLELMVGPTLNLFVGERRLMSVTTARQGLSLQVVYEARLKSGASAVGMVSALNKLEGVQEVRMQRQGFDLDV